MTTGRGNLERADSSWRDIRADADIQFEPIPPRPPPEPPAWIKDLQEWLESIFGPVGRALVEAWPVLKWALLAMAVLFVAYLLWQLLSPYFLRPGSDAGDDLGWQPDRAETLALLEDADRLAEAGDYGAAVHLLLNRSVGQIAIARPDMVAPSSTARELAGQPSLPDKARAAFGVIATAVERNIFALQELGRDDWQQARGAYADFALERLR
ncbi:hypothetical protein LY632_14040 [Erythrobacter sp. SDW2]|uniref:hypothetical protein n=1 Tax=Erythrobacter sp. SDW2 TaxID=2907154 RepID=UPI001F488066|nr:hypothetical protein [Erythrobacter sp. SDW2]UIP06773.1 hypothetical protein LY632_14040 [Erythrobacter sp. SDW2]